MSTHLDSGAFPALGTRADKPSRKTPAPWDLPRSASESMLGAPLVMRRDPGRTARASSANLRVVPEEVSGPHAAAAALPFVSARAWWAFEAGLAAMAAVAVFLL